MKWSREPAAWAVIVVAIVSAIATWDGNPFVSESQLPIVIAVVNAVAAFVVAIRVRPIAPAVIVAVVSPLAALLAGYGVHVDPDLIGVVNTMLVPAVLGLIARPQQTPIDTESGATV